MKHRLDGSLENRSWRGQNRKNS